MTASKTEKTSNYSSKVFGKDLDEFRKAWVEEIKNSFKRGVCQQNLRPKSSRIEAQSENKLDELKKLHDKSLNLEKECRNKTNDNTKAIKYDRTNLLSKPFDIAEKLLQGQTLTFDDIYGKKLSETGSSPKLKKKIKSNEEPNKSLLDQLIADIDEITEIPFFDLSLPREVGIKIFQYLDIVDLCRCAQVSKSWKNLAEDELLWWQICHQSGFNSENKVIERTHWKTLFQETIEREHKVRINWKGRIVKLEELENIRGGILTAACSFKNYVFAGYSSGAVTLWDISELEDCTSILIETDAEVGRNPVNSVAINESVAVAGYSSGMIKVWSLLSDLKRDRTFNLGETAPLLALSSSYCCLCAVYGCHLYILSSEKSEWEQEILNFNSQILHLKFMNEVPNGLVVVTENNIDFVLINKIKTISGIHALIGSSVTCMDSRQDIMACGIISRTGYSTFQLSLFDIETCNFLMSLNGHTSPISCVNMHQSPPHLLITGCKDKCLRVYDVRCQQETSTIQGHAYGVSAVQMDDWKILSGGEEGLVCVWDHRMLTKCWETHSRYPVRYLTFEDALMITANIPEAYVHLNEEYETVFHRRQRGSLRIYDFSVNHLNKEVPSICHSSFDEPMGYNFNIILSTPYDQF